MIGSSAYNYVNVLDKAADASWMRNEVITNNLANVDTPGFKRKDVQFESYLMSAIGNGADTLDESVSKLELDTLQPTVYTEYSNLSYRYDKNNVDIDVESAELAKNQIRYYTLLDSMSQEFSRMKMVMNKNS